MNRRQVLITIFALGLGFAGGYWTGRHSRTLGTPSPARVNSEVWMGQFKIPGSVGLPEKVPVIRCAFRRDLMSRFGWFQATMTNLTDRSYLVRYQIFGYDSLGRRVSDSEDEFAIGVRETVMRQLTLNSQVSSPAESIAARFGTTFWIQMKVDH